MEDEFYTKVVGVTFENRQLNIKKLCIGEKLMLIRQPHNEYDHNAIGVYSQQGFQIGFIKKHIAEELAPIIDGGDEFDVYVTSITGGAEEYAYGVNIMIQKTYTCYDKSL